MILAGYGAYLAYDQLTGSDTPAAVSTTGYEATVERAIGAGEWSIILGLGFHNLKDSYVVRDQFNAEIQNIRNERANLESLLPNVLGPRSDTVRASIESLGELETAIAQWRDALFLLRFGNVDAAQDAIESANAQLTQQLETWKGQEGT